MIDIPAIQSALREFGLDGWLLYDFRGLNVLARRVLALESGGLQSRRYLYFIPAHGEPRKLVHRIEMAALESLPGSKQVYLKWQELEAGIAGLLQRSKRIAMEYAPRVSNPYISRVDGGTIEMVRSLGVEIVSSGDLVQLFESTWDDSQWQMHQEAAVYTQSAYEMAWKLIADRATSGKPATEVEVQQAIMDHFHRHGMTTYSPPIVGVGPHSGDPHFEPSPATDTPIGPGAFVLIDLWAKMDRPRSVYSDLTRVGFVGKSVPDEYESVFQVVRLARDAAIDCVRKAYDQGRPLAGWEVDDAARGVIESAGYGPYFVHRTGHNIGQEVHGNGAHMDNLETHEERLVLPRTCFSIEPGIYREEFGVRSEINVYIDSDRKVHVTGGLQKRVRPILAGIPDDLID
ncbi:MAG: M24 family metallopeptidase [Isosphaeraceae bacterium]